MLENLRDHMANERTYLAWIRTSIGIMAFGFVVEKFSLFLEEISHFLGGSKLVMHNHTAAFFQGYSAYFGIILILLGVLICIFAFIKYKRIEKQIAANTYSATIRLDATLMLIVSAIGIFLALYLIIF